MFEVGMSVVCVDAGPKKEKVGPVIPIHHLLREGAIYTVDAIFYSTREHNRLTGQISLKLLTDGSTLALREVSVPAPMQGFASYRFRPYEPLPPRGEIIQRELETV